MTLSSIVRNFAKANGFDVTTSANGKNFTMTMKWGFCEFGTIAIVKMSENINDTTAEVITENGSVKVSGNAALLNALEEAWAA